MKWYFGVFELRTNGNESQHGRHDSETVAAKRSLRRRCEHRAASISDLAKLASEFGFMWNDGPNLTLKAKAALGKKGETFHLMRREEDDFDTRIEECLLDIGRVASRLGVPRKVLNKGEWRLVNGSVDIYLRDPEGGDCFNPKDYTRMTIVLRLGEIDGKKCKDIYEWNLQYCHKDSFIVTRPLENFPISKIEQIATRVFVISTKTRSKGVLKIEPTGNQNRNENEARYDSVLHLYRQLFECTPGSCSMIDEDIAHLEGKKIKEGDKYETAQDNPKGQLLNFCGADSSFVRRKMEFKACGPSLKDIIELPSNNTEMNRAELRKKVFNSIQFYALGRMAAVDAVVGNEDRIVGNYKNEKRYTINIDNIDFDLAGRIIAIDNVDPNSSIMNKHEADFDDFEKAWPAYTYMTDKSCWGRFARDIFDAIGKATSLVGEKDKDYEYLLKTCGYAFVEGLAHCIEDMKLVLPSFEQQWKPGSEQKLKALPTIVISKRIRALL